MNIVISNSGEIPIYEQIASQIKKRRDSRGGEAWGAASVAEILGQGAESQRVSTKRAYEELEREGYITSVPGKGSFAAEINRELLREEQYKRLEEHLNEAVDARGRQGSPWGR